MILQSLTSYYEALEKKGKVPKYGYAMGKVAFLLSIDMEGGLRYITPLTEQVARGRGTTTVNQERQIPLPFVRANAIRPQFLCDTSSYILGLSSNGRPERVKECFQQSRTFHQEVLKDCSSPVAQAVLAFFQQWEPNENHEVISASPELLNGGFIIIEVLEHGIAHVNPDIQKAWTRYLDATQSDIIMPCLVTGELSPTARLHYKIKGVSGAQSSGANLVSFNADSTESFGKETGAIAPVSEYANFAYTTGLNYLLNNPDSRCQIGEDTVVFWTQGDDEAATQVFGSFLNPDNKKDDFDKLKGVMQSIASGSPVQNINLDTTCYILALSPNAARLSVRYFLRNTLGHFLKNIAAHYERLEIAKYEKASDFLSPYAMLRETANPNARTITVSPLLGGAVMRAILNNTPYPEALYTATLLRIRATQDNADKQRYKITWGRAAIIKACLMKKNLPQTDMEVLTVMLNPDSTNKAYTLGRLFSVLEDIQQKANPGIKSTIKDRYFNAASSTPLITFPNLIRLSGHHLKKIDAEGMVINYQKSMGELMDKLDVDNEPFPPRLNLKEQGLFLLGYYQQTQNRYIKKEDR